MRRGSCPARHGSLLQAFSSQAPVALGFRKNDPCRFVSTPASARFAHGGWVSWLSLQLNVHQAPDLTKAIARVPRDLSRAPREALASLGPPCGARCARLPLSRLRRHLPQRSPAQPGGVRPGDPRFARGFWLVARCSLLVARLLGPSPPSPPRLPLPPAGGVRRSGKGGELETGDWRLETGDWRLETGDWRLETGD